MPRSMMFCVFSARGRMRIIPLFRRLSPKRRCQKLMGEDIRKNEMSDLLTRTITGLLAAGRQAVIALALGCSMR